MPYIKGRFNTKKKVNKEKKRRYLNRLGKSLEKYSKKQLDSIYRARKIQRQILEADAEYIIPHKIQEAKKRTAIKKHGHEKISYVLSPKSEKLLAKRITIEQEELKKITSRQRAFKKKKKLR